MWGYETKPFCFVLFALCHPGASNPNSFSWSSDSGQMCSLCVYMFLFFVFFFHSWVQAIVQFSQQSSGTVWFFRRWCRKRIQSMNMCILSAEMFGWIQPTNTSPVDFITSSKIVFAMIFRATNAKKRLQNYVYDCVRWSKIQLRSFSYPGGIRKSRKWLMSRGH